MVRNKKEEQEKESRRILNEINELKDRILAETVIVKLDKPIFNGYLISNVPTHVCTQDGLAEAIRASTEILHFADKPFVYNNLKFKIWKKKKKVHFNKNNYINGSCGFIALSDNGYKSLSQDAKKWFRKVNNKTHWGSIYVNYVIQNIPYGSYEEKITKTYITEVRQEPHHLKRLLDDLEKSIPYDDKQAYYYRKWGKDIDCREWKMSKGLAIERILKREFLDKKTNFL